MISINEDDLVYSLMFITIEKHNHHHITIALMKLHYGKNDNINNLNDMPMNITQTKRARRLPPTIGRFVFHITTTMIQLLQMKEHFGGLAHKDLNEHLIYVVN